VQKNAQTVLRTISKQIAHQITSSWLKNQAMKMCGEDVGCRGFGP